MIPLVLHHGIFGFGQLEVGGHKIMSYFTRIDRALAQLGHPLIISRVHPTGSVARRAAQLKDTITSGLTKLKHNDQRVIVIAHSMGGLDARYMISRLDMADRVVALLTITTPHRGSPYADWTVRHLGQRLRGLQLMDLLGIDVEGVVDLTTERCAVFNQEIADAPHVKYYSISCARPWNQITPVLLQPFRVIEPAEGPNDGMVSLRSAQWGEHLGTWPADHLHSINKRLVVEFKNGTGDITPYYLEALKKVLHACGGAEPRTQ